MNLSQLLFRCLSSSVVSLLPLSLVQISEDVSAVKSSDTWECWLNSTEVMALIYSVMDSTTASMWPAQTSTLACFMFPHVLACLMTVTSSLSWREIIIFAWTGCFIMVWGDGIIAALIEAMLQQGASWLRGGGGGVGEAGEWAACWWHSHRAGRKSWCCNCAGIKEMH